MQCLLVIFSSITLMLTIVDVTKATNYCDPSLCLVGTHIACHNNGAFSRNCPRDAKLVKITPALKKLLVDGHNAKRNYVAGGLDKKLDPACRMATMAWNDELASLAALNVKRCKFEHDSCHNTVKFRYSGQSIFQQKSTGVLNEKESLESAVNSWYNEIKLCNMNIIHSFHDINDGSRTVGHFTAMVSDENTHLGCAAATYSEPGSDFKTLILACNYATGNMNRAPVYKSCNKPAEKCKTGTNQKYPNLCSAAEKYY